MLNLLILVAGAAAIAWVNWYFFLAPKAVAVAKTTGAGIQEVRITVEGGYSPSAVSVKQGARVRLIFDRKEKSPCSEEVVISEFGIRRFLKPFEETVVEFTPAKPGTHPFACGMNMLRGQIEVEPQEAK